MENVTLSTFQNFIDVPVAVLLFDADWDIGPGSIIRATLAQVEQLYQSRVAFGKVNIDKELELASMFSIRNIPAIGYFQQGRLTHLKIGASQNIELYVASLLDVEQ